jgi:hypothetical protein
VSRGEECFLINQFYCKVRKDEQVEKEHIAVTWTSSLAGQKTLTYDIETESVKDRRRGNGEGFLNSGKFLLNKQLESIGFSQLHSPMGVTN